MSTHHSSQGSTQQPIRTSDTHLRQVRRAATKAAQARQGLDQAIQQAHAAGHSLRAIAKEAGLSPEWVRRIAQQKPSSL